jgi:hypothetical protein
MRIQFLAVCVAVSGCTFDLKTCKTDTDCVAGGTCSQGFCVAAGGAIGGGSGGGTGGGNQGGGGGGSPTGGGTPSECVGVQCQPWEECVVDGGAVCLPADISVQWVNPSPADVRIFRNGNQDVFPVASLPVTPVGQVSTAFTFAGSIWHGELMLPSGAANDGDWVFVAGWPDGGPSATLTIYRDTTKPDVLLTVYDRDGGTLDPGYWKKDEAALVRIDVSDDAVPVTAADLILGWDAGVSNVSCTTDAGHGSCFAIGLATAPLFAVRGQLPIAVRSIQDQAGNFSVQTDAGFIKVTRLKWRDSIALASSSIPLAPLAVSRAGSLIATAGNGATSTRIVVTRFDPDAGKLTYSYDAAVEQTQLTAGPMLDDSNIWFAVQDDGVASVIGGETVFYGLPIASMAGVSKVCSQTAGLGATPPPIRGQLALGGLSDAGYPIGVRNGVIQLGSGSGCWTSSLPSPFDSSASQLLVSRWNDADSRVETFVAQEAAGRLWKSSLDPDSSVNGLMGFASLPAGTQPRGLFFIGSEVVGGGGVANNGKFVLAHANGVLDGGVFSTVDAANAGPLVIGNGFYIFAAYDSLATPTGRLLRGELDGGFVISGPSVANNTGASDVQSKTPILGAGGLVYVQGKNGIAVHATADLNEQWRWDDVVTTEFAEATLDVYRDALGGKRCDIPLGVLYVMRRQGNQGQVTAILVDSQGLDSSAEWPKFQRDNANTGNVSRTTAPWTCP